MEKTQIVSGTSTYVYRLIEGKQYLVLESDPDNLDFTFQEKFDKTTGKAFFVSVLTRSKVWELPDVAALPEMEPMPQEINIGCTVFKTCRSADGELIFAPEKLPIELANGHCWVPQADRIYGRYTFRNAATGKRCVTLPPTNDYCQRIQRMYAKYSIGSTVELKTFLSERAGTEEEALAELIASHGEEPKEYLHTKEQICAVFCRFDPSRMPEVIELLEANEGPEKEAALLETLKGRYGEIPKTYRERIAAIFAKYCPERLELMPAVMATFADREVGLIAALVKKHGPEPGTEKDASLSSPEVGELKRRVIALLICHSPSTINTSFEQGMGAHKGDIKAFLDALIAKYGGEPSEADRDSMFESYLSTPADPETQHFSPVSSRPPVLIKPSAYRDRLTRFYAHYNPSKLGSIDKMLRRYEGGEEQLIAELVKTYGPEPDPPASTADEKETTKTAAAEDTVANVTSTAGDSTRDATTMRESSGAGETPEQVPTTALPPSHQQTQHAAASAAVVASPRHFELSDEELKLRALNLALVYDPSSLDALETLLASAGAPLALYNELLDQYGGKDPSPDQVATARRELDRLREEERAKEMALAEEARMAREAQQQHVSALMAEMEALKVKEAERDREEEARRIREEEDRQRQFAALSGLAEAEARRKEAEQSVESLARTSEFAVSDEDDMRLSHINNQVGEGTGGQTNAAASSATMTVTSSLATIDSTTLIGTLAALEEKLQKAYNQVEASIRKGDALRRANEELQFEINELRNLMAEREKDARIALIEAKNESDRLLNAQEKEKLEMRANEQNARAEILSSFRTEQQKMNEDLLRMTAEARDLNDEVSRQKGEIREFERNIRTLQARLAAKEASEIEAKANLKLLEDAIAQKPGTDSNFCQTDDTDVYSSRVFMSPREYFNHSQVASIDELQSTVRALESEVADWRLRFVEAQTDYEAARAQQSNISEEYDTALRVIHMLRAKNKKLEAHARSLELRTVAAAGGHHAAGDSAAEGGVSGLYGKLSSASATPSRGLEGAMMAMGGTPRTAVNSQYTPTRGPFVGAGGASISSPPTVVSGGHALSPSSVRHTSGLTMSNSPTADVSEVKRRLAASDAESRALRKEIADLRGLLAMYMSSPKSTTRR